MARKRRSFSREFKLEAVGLMTDGGLSVAQAARDLGISGSVLGRWKRQFEEDPAEAFPGKGRLKPQDEELARLRRENEVLRQERDILKNKDRQVHCGKKRIARLMRENGIRAKQKKKFKATTDSQHCHPVSPNLLQRDFEADMPDRKWLADITYISTREGWLYLAAILGLHSKIIVGWSMARRMTKRLVLEALEMAVGRRHPEPGLIHHSDRGSQYACGDYPRALRSHGMICSMNRKGDCWDNAPMDSWFHTLKTELVSRGRCINSEFYPRPDSLRFLAMNEGEAPV